MIENYVDDLNKIIGELKGTTLTWGTPQAFTDHTCANIDVACTDQGTGRVVVAYPGTTQKGSGGTQSIVSSNRVHSFNSPGTFTS